RQLSELLQKNLCSPRAFHRLGLHTGGTLDDSSLHTPGGSRPRYSPLAHTDMSRKFQSRILGNMTRLPYQVLLRPTHRSYSYKYYMYRLSSGALPGARHRPPGTPPGPSQQPVHPPSAPLKI